VNSKKTLQSVGRFPIAAKTVGVGSRHLLLPACVTLLVFLDVDSQCECNTLGTIGGGDRFEWKVYSSANQMRVEVHPVNFCSRRALVIEATIQKTNVDGKTLLNTNVTEIFL